jgi:hypothetical protein
MTSKRLSTGELRPSERLLVAAMERLAFGRFERLMIRNGEPVLAPWPRTVQEIRLGAEPPEKVRSGAREVTLKHQVVELIEYIRSVGAGEILVLKFRRSLPCSMEIEVGRQRRPPENAATAGGIQRHRQ